ncbi:HAD family hydrolase [Eubacteriales bacterium KG127]
MNKVNRSFDIKMIGLDLDGTTLKYGDKFSERTLESFKKAKNQGTHVVIATGRTIKSLPPQIYDISEIEYVITSNGAHITRLEDMQIIYENIIKEDAVKAVVEVARNLGYVFEAFIRGTAYIDKNVFNQMQSMPEKYEYRDIDYVLRTRKPVENIFSYVLAHKNGIENISITFPKNEDRVKIINNLEGIKGITLTSSFQYNIEIGGENTSKATALNFLLNQFELSKENLLACGDSPNDAEMINMAAIGVAMSDSHPDILAMADYVTDDCYNDGVAKAIEKFVICK